MILEVTDYDDENSGREIKKTEGCKTETVLLASTINFDLHCKWCMPSPSSCRSTSLIKWYKLNWRGLDVLTNFNLVYKLSCKDKLRADCREPRKPKNFNFFIFYLVALAT